MSSSTLFQKYTWFATSSVLFFHFHKMCNTYPEFLWGANSVAVILEVFGGMWKGGEGESYTLEPTGREFALVSFLSFFQPVHVFHQSPPLRQGLFTGRA